jgi:hypothetical protein
MPGPLAFGRRPGQIEELLDAAGFDDIEADAVDFAFRAASLDEFWDQAIRRSGRFSVIVSGLEPAAHYRLRDAVDAAFAPYVRDGGALEIPARALVAAASA